MVTFTVNKHIKNENIVTKGEIARYEQFLLLSQCLKICQLYETKKKKKKKPVVSNVVIGLIVNGAEGERVNNICPNERQLINSSCQRSYYTTVHSVGSRHDSLPTG